MCTHLDELPQCPAQYVRFKACELLQPLDSMTISSMRTWQTLRTLPRTQHHSDVNGGTASTRSSTKTCDCAQLTGLAATIFVCCLSALQDTTGHVVDVSLGRFYCCTVNSKLTGSQSRGLYGGQEVFVSLVIRCPLTFSQVYCTHLSSGGT